MYSIQSGKKMKDRIQQFIDYKNITPGELADILGVQRSNISHILNGRNKPGATFIEKFLLAFPKVNARWLFTGEEPMVMDAADKSKSSQTVPKEKVREELLFSSVNRQNEKYESPGQSPKKILEKVVLLYSDGTFLSYNA